MTDAICQEKNVWLKCPVSQAGNECMDEEGLIFGKDVQE